MKPEMILKKIIRLKNGAISINSLYQDTSSLFKSRKEFDDIIRSLLKKGEIIVTNGIVISKDKVMRNGYK